MSAEPARAYLGIGEVIVFRFVDRDNGHKIHILFSALEKEFFVHTYKRVTK